MLNIALPKGRLGEKAYSLLEKIGYKCEEFDSGKRLPAVKTYAYTDGDLQEVKE